MFHRIRLAIGRVQELVKVTKPAVVLCDDETPFQDLEVRSVACFVGTSFSKPMDGGSEC